MAEKFLAIYTLLFLGKQKMSFVTLFDVYKLVILWHRKIEMNFLFQGNRMYKF